MATKLRLVKKDETIEAGEAMENGRGRKRSYRKLAILLVFVVAAAAIAAVVYYGSSGGYSGTALLSSVEFKHGGAVSTLPYEDGYMYVTRDGAEAIDSSDKKLWNITYDMKNPIAEVCGKCAVVGDLGGRKLYISDGTGTVNKIDLTSDIADVAVSQTSIAAVWTDCGTEDHIYLYDIKGKMLLDVMTTPAGNGYPIDIAISEDGRKMITSYIVIEDGNTTCWVTFYNFGGVGQTYVDKIVGSYSYEKNISPCVKFVSNDSAVICLEDGVDIYTYRELPELSESIRPEGKIKGMFFDEDTSIGFVVETVDDHGAQDGSYTFETYSTSGNKKGSFTYSGTYLGIDGMHGDILVYTQSGFKVFSTSGSLKLAVSEDHEIKSMHSVSNDTAVIMEGGRIRLIRLTR